MMERLTDEQLSAELEGRIALRDSYIKHGYHGTAAAYEVTIMALTELKERRIAISQLPQPAVGDGRAEFEAWMLKGWGRDRESYDFIMAPTISGKDYADSYTRHMWKAWSASRDAMLQGKAEPVSQPYPLPAGMVAVPVEMAPEQMRAVQVNSELGAYAAANLTGAYDLFREFWDVAIAAAPQQEVSSGQN